MVQQLVTGGAGFIGSHLVEALLGRGYQVRVVDSLITGHKENLAGFLSDIEFIEGDLADPQVAARAVQGVECVFHEAAIPSVPRSVRNPLQTQRSGEISTLNLLDAAVRADVRRVIFAASSSAYGNTEVLPKVETMPPRPLSPYAASKIAGEGYMSAFAACHNLDTVSLRYFNVFGPRQDPTSQYSGVIAKFTDIMPRGIRPVIFGDGEQSRDFCFVKNVVHANLLAMDCPERLGGEVMNIGCGGRITLNELVAILNRIFGTDHTPIYESTRAGDVRHSLASIAKAKALIGYEPLVQVEEGLRRTIEYQMPQ
ncbi:MAG TPA: SDR family oxidoreductase [Acidobacteriota bacterium]|nr:SDR family oxidoreductase [Acidobacteriota bacterium]